MLERFLLVVSFGLLVTSVGGQSFWSVPGLEPALNSTATDSAPHLSVDGLTLHFSSLRSGNNDLWMSTRTSKFAPWAAPVTLAMPLNTASSEDGPFLSADGLELWFASNRVGAAGLTDIMRATRTSTAVAFGAPAFVTEVNSASGESQPTLTADGLEIYFLSTGFGAPSAPNNSIFRATRVSTSAPFSPPSVVAELLNANTHRDVEIAPDGLTITYTEFLPAPISRIYILQAKRLTRLAAFSAPVTLTEFNTVGTSLGVYGVTLSSDGLEMILAAGFSAAAGALELMSTRFNGLARSGAAGVTTTMTLSLRDGLRPGFAYLLAASLGNTGFNLGPVFVPLDNDFVFGLTLATDLPPFTAGWAGALDVNGEAVATVGDPPALLTGLQMYIAGAVLDFSAPGNVGLMSSAIQIEFQLL